MLGIAFALWTHKYGGFIAFFIQMLVLIPWVTSQVVGAMLWKWLLNEDVGLINYVIGKLGGSRLHFFSNETVAMGCSYSSSHGGRLAMPWSMYWRPEGHSRRSMVAAIIDGSQPLAETHFTSVCRWSGLRS